MKKNVIISGNESGRRPYSLNIDHRSLPSLPSPFLPEIEIGNRNGSCTEQEGIVESVELRVSLPSPKLDFFLYAGYMYKYVPICKV
jgi:hypothetical protein